jgi:hypothetical protein
MSTYLLCLKSITTIETNQTTITIMIPNSFRFWSTNREDSETLLISYKPYTAKPRRARSSPYPTRPASSANGYPLKPLRPEVSTTISDYCNPKLTIWRFQSLCSISKRQRWYTLSCLALAHPKARKTTVLWLPQSTLIVPWLPQSTLIVPMPISNLAQSHLRTTKPMQLQIISQTHLKTLLRRGLDELVPHHTQPGLRLQQMDIL